MATTIQIKDKTLNLLKILKEKEKAANYDVIIAQLAANKLNKSDVFGVLKDTSMRYGKEDRLDIDGR